MRGHAPDHGRTHEAIGSALEVRDQRSNAVRLTGAVRDSEAPQLEHRLAPIAQVRGAVGDHRDPLLSDAQKNQYADKGLENVDKALKLKPDYFEAVIYKGLLYRVKAGATSDRRAKTEFLEKAQDLQKQGLELKKGSVAVLSCGLGSPEAGGCRLVALLSPAALRDLPRPRGA